VGEVSQTDFKKEFPHIALSNFEIRAEGRYRRISFSSKGWKSTVFTWEGVKALNAQT